MVTPETVVVTYEIGNKEEVQPGTKIFVSRREEAGGRDGADAAHHLWQERAGAGVLTPTKNAPLLPKPKTNFNGENMMRSIVSMTLAACAMVVVSSPTFAQAPAPAAPPPAPPSAGGTPDAMPFDIPYGMSIGLERAKQVMAAAEAEAKKRNWKMNIAVVDTNGELVQFERMEGAQIASGSISIGKARTAARFRRESRAVLQCL